jgi:hypothetical protein
MNVHATRNQKSLWLAWAESLDIGCNMLRAAEDPTKIPQYGLKGFNRSFLAADLQSEATYLAKFPTPCSMSSLVQGILR